MISRFSILQDLYLQMHGILTAEDQLQFNMECTRRINVQFQLIEVCFSSDALLGTMCLEHLGLVFLASHTSGSGSWHASFALLLASECSQVQIRRPGSHCFPCTSSFHSTTSGKRGWRHPFTATAYQDPFVDIGTCSTQHSIRGLRFATAVPSGIAALWPVLWSLEPTGRAIITEICSGL